MTNVVFHIRNGYRRQGRKFSKKSHCLRLVEINSLQVGNPKVDEITRHNTVCFWVVLLCGKRTPFSGCK